MKTKNIFKILFLSLTLFSVGNFSVANTIKDVEKVELKKELGKNDLQGSIIVSQSPNDKDSTVAKKAKELGFEQEIVTDSQAYTNDSISNYIKLSMPYFIIIIIVASIFCAFAFAYPNNEYSKKGKDLLIPIFTHSVSYFGLLGGTGSLLGGFFLTLFLSVAATSNGWTWGIIKNKVADSYLIDTKQFHKLPAGDKEFNSFLDAATGEKRTLQARVALLHDKPELRDLSVNEFAEYFTEIAEYKVEKTESLTGFISGYNFIAKTKEQPFYSFGKDNLNYPAETLSINYATANDAESQDLNVDAYSRRGIITKIVDVQSYDTFSLFNELEANIKTDLDAGNSNYLNADYKKSIDIIEKDMTQTMNAFYEENDGDNQLVDDAEFIYNFIKAKYKGLDKNMSALKYFKRGREISKLELDIHCTQNSEAKKFTDQNFNKFINSTKRVSDAVLDSKVNFECILIENGKFVQLGFDETKDAAKIKEAVNTLKAYKEAGNILYKIVNAAGSISMANFVAENYNAMEELRQYERLGAVGLLAGLRVTTNAGYAAYKLNSSNRADIIINNNFSNNLLIVEDAIFGMSDEDLFKTSEKEKEYALSHFNKLNRQAYYNSNVNLKKFSIDDFKLAEQSGKSEASNEIVDSMLSVALLGLDNTAKYAAALPQNLSITEGLAFCRIKGNCDNIYKPSLYEIQVNAGKEYAQTGFACLAAIYTIKGVSKTLDVSSTQGLIGKVAVVAKTAAKGIKAAVVGAEIIASTYETPCTVTLIAGITMGYITPIFQIAAGSITVIIITISFILLIIVGPVVVLASFVMSFFGNTTILKDYYMRLAGYLLQTFIFGPVVLIVMFIYSMPLHHFVRMLLSYGYSSSSTGIMTMLFTLLIVFTVITTLSMAAFKLISTFINDISGALRMPQRIDSSSDMRLASIAVSSSIGSQLASNAKMTISNLANLASTNSEENKRLEENQKAINELSKKYFEGKTEKDLETDFKDPKIKKLYEDFKNSEK